MVTQHRFKYTSKKKNETKELFTLTHKRRKLTKRASERESKNKSWENIAYISEQRV